MVVQLWLPSRVLAVFEPADQSTITQAYSEDQAQQRRDLLTCIHLDVVIRGGCGGALSWWQYW